MGYDELSLFIVQDQIPNDPTQNVRPTKNRGLVLNRDRKLLNKQNTLQTVCILPSLPGYSQHQTSDNALHAALWNVLKKLPANSLPHHVCAGACRQPRSHHSQNKAYAQKDGQKKLKKKSIYCQ